MNKIGKALIWMSLIAAVALIVTVYYVPRLEHIAKETGAPLTVLQSALFSVTDTLKHSGFQLLGFLAVLICAGIILCLFR